MNFRRFLPAISLLLFWTSTSFTKPPPPKKASSTVIQGVIKNYEKYSKTKIVQLKKSLSDVVDPDREAKVKPNGTFEIRFTQFDKEKYILSPFPNIHIYTHPGDSLLITIDLDKARNTIFDGTSGNNNLILNEFFREGTFNPGNTYLYNSNAYTPMGFLAKMNELNDQNQKNLQAFMAKHQLSEEQIDLLEALMLKKNYQTLLEFGMKRHSALSHANNVESKHREELVQYFKNITSRLGEDIDGLANHISEEELMDGYLFYLMEVNLGVDRKDIIQEGYIFYFLDLLDQSVENPGLKDHLFYRLNVLYMDLVPDFYQANKDQFLSKIQASSLREKVADFEWFRKYQRQYIQPMKNYKLEDLQVNDELAEAIKKAEGKTIYLDFWATWCGPCREDMKASKEAVAKAQAKGDIEVIYVCVDSNESERENFITSNEIPGTHITIPREATAKIMSSFGNSGYPFQVIINPNGGIIAKGNHYRFMLPATQKLLDYKNP